MTFYSVLLSLVALSCLAAGFPKDIPVDQEADATDGHVFTSTEEQPQMLIDRSKENAVSRRTSSCLNRSGIPPKDEWYPAYHLAPPTGWMNDPNGLIYFDGLFHAFFQHYPNAPVWGPMHWGHARSSNMVQWEHLPIALEPSLEEDKDGCFSGSAVDDNGVLSLIYTGHSIFNGSEQYHQVQCLATSEDGLNFEKVGKVLDAPEGVNDFRDPKVFRDGDFWYMVAGLKVDNKGEVRLYKSSDLRNWEEESILAVADKKLGYMWECPDFFPLGDKQVLLMSPQGIAPVRYDYRNLFQSGYIIGSWEAGSKFEMEHDFVEIDHGHDFYAPQTFLGPGDRRIMIGWMAMWESPMPEQKQEWATMLTLPRELTLTDGGKILVNPVKEVEEIRSNSSTIERKVLEKESVQLECDVKTMEVSLQWNISASQAEKYGLRLGDSDLNDGGLYLFVDTQSQRLVLDRRYPQYQLNGYRSVPLPEGDLLSLRVFFDHSSVEVFVNDGIYSLTSRIYPLENERCLSLFAENGPATLESSTRWLLRAKPTDHK